MIPQIKERRVVNGVLQDGWPSYATMHEATVTLSEMGEHTISTQVRIDGDIVPDFEGWELEFKGERFVLPIKDPQAAKDNTTRNSLVDLTFTSWPVNELKRYFFVEMSSINSSTAIPNKYIASLALDLPDFVDAFNLVLDYYFAGKIKMDLFESAIYSQERSFVEINYTHIWDVLQKMYEIYNVRWRIDYNATQGKYYIKVGYSAPAINDHDFEYGYSGGLLRFERQVQDDNITNILLGRGGEKNLPYRYFKRTDPQNDGWAPDPDAIPELANIYFDRLHDINFRNYIQGWRTNSHRDTSWEAVQPYDSARGATDWAYAKGHTDTGFNPVEYVKDDISIEKYGERWGALDDNDDIYPTIQGQPLPGIGRVDEVVDVSPILTDDIYETAKKSALVTSLRPVTVAMHSYTGTTYQLYSEEFTVPQGMTGNVSYEPLEMDTVNPGLVHFDTENSTIVAEASNGSELPIVGLPAGTYRLKVNMVIRRSPGATSATGTFGITSVSVSIAESGTDTWKPTFDIWVKNIWDTEKAAGETDEEYAQRVWSPILGDRLGNEAKVVFSDGFMSISEDYEFKIASIPVFDQSKLLNGVQSEWKITLYKSDAEFDATGLFVPNATTGGQPIAGDHFFFIGIDMPHLYVVWAEERLNAWKTDNLGTISDLSPTWVIQLDKVRVHTIEDEDYGVSLADRLEAGALVRTTDRRFTNGQVLSLYVQTITYRWNEPSDGNPYLVPDIEIVLSDKIAAVESRVSQIESQVDVIKTTYAKTADIESTVRRVATPLFLMKTGESDSSNSPTTFASKVSSRDFRQGDVGGVGWGIYDDNGPILQVEEAAVEEVPGTEKSSVIEVDKLIVRKEMSVNNLVVNQISYVGGKQIISAAAIECTDVRETNSTYVCYFNQRQGSVANLFQVGDIAYGQVFDSGNVSLRYYKMVVTATDINSITLSKSPKDGSGFPKKGDTIVQFGNTTDVNRQYVILRDVIGGGYETMLSGLNSVLSTGKEYYYAGKQGATGTERWFVGDAQGQFAEYKNGELNINGRLSITSQVAKTDGSYVALSTYLNTLQQQIDGTVSTWYESGEPKLSNYPASTWTTIADKNNHIGDLYYDSNTGKAYRFMLNGNDYVWAPIADNDIAAALTLGQQNQTAIAGLDYLKQATNNGTLIQGGLVLTSLIQLGNVSNGTYNVWAGINGVRNDEITHGGIAAWYGGPMEDYEENPLAANYAKSLFRFDGSGYLAGGKIKWREDGSGSIPGISWSGNDIIIGGNVKLASVSGDSVTELLSLVRDLSNMWDLVTENGVTFVRTKNNYPIVSNSFISGGGLSSGSSSGSLVSELKDLDDVDNNLNPSANQVLTYSGGRWTAMDAQSGIQSITLSGAVSGSGTSTISTTLSSNIVNTINLVNESVTLAKLATEAKSMSLWGQTATLGSAVVGDMSSVGKITFSSQSSAAGSGNVLEVVSRGGLTYLHSTLPIVSDSFISGGGVNNSGGGGGGAEYLSDLEDVSISGQGPNDGDVLQYVVEGGGGYWTNQALSLALGDLSNVSTTGAAYGNVLKFNGTSWEPGTVSGGSSTLAGLSDTSISASPYNKVLWHNGTAWVDRAFTLSNLSDTLIEDVEDGQFLGFDGDNWVNMVIGLGDLSNVNTTGATNGQALVYNSTSQTWVPGTVGGGGSSVSLNVRESSGTTSANLTSVWLDERALSTAGDVAVMFGGDGSLVYGRTYHFPTVTISSSSLQDGQVLAYDATNHVWVNSNSSGGSSVSIDDLLSDGTTIATLTIDGTDYTIKAPSGGSGGGSTTVRGYNPNNCTVDIKDTSYSGYSSRSFTLLTDVSINSPSDGEVLVYDSGYWVNGSGGGSYTLPTASTSTLGGVKVSASATFTPTTATSGTYYGVSINSSGKLGVRIPSGSGGSFDPSEATDLIPHYDSSYDLGDANNYWNNLYVREIKFRDDDDHEARITFYEGHLVIYGADLWIADGNVYPNSEP